jgi:hypothetical protein
VYTVCADAKAICTAALEQASTIGEHLAVHDVQHSAVLIKVDVAKVALRFAVTVVHERAELAVAVEAATEHEAVAWLEHAQGDEHMRESQCVDEEGCIEGAFASSFFEGNGVFTRSECFGEEDGEEEGECFVDGLACQ